MRGNKKTRKGFIRTIKEAKWMVNQHAADAAKTRAASQARKASE